MRERNVSLIQMIDSLSLGAEIPWKSIAVHSLPSLDKMQSYEMERGGWSSVLVIKREGGGKLPQNSCQDTDPMWAPLTQAGAN